METNDVKPTVKKTTTRKPSTKSTTKKSTKTVKPVEEKPNDALATLASLSPEMLEQLVTMLHAQKEPVTNAEPVKPKRLNKTYLNTIRDEEVEVRNLTNGIVVFSSQKTGTTYKWMGKDEVEIMTIGEVMTMHSQSEKFLKTPWLIVDNEDVMVGLGLSEIKKQVEEFEDLDEVLTLPPHQIKQKLSTLSPTYLAQISDTVGAKIMSGELRDVYVIRELEEFFGRKFLI